MKTMTLSPAYGVDYKSKTEVVAALKEGRDFTSQTFGVPGKYASIRDVISGGYTHIEVRFGRALSKMCMIDVAKELSV